MAITLVSTGITFPDGTTQTTAATAGLTISIGKTTLLSNQGNFNPDDHAPFNAGGSTINFSGQIASIPYGNVNSRRFHTPYGQAQGPSMTASPTSPVGVNFSRFQDIPPDPGDHNSFASGRWTFGHAGGSSGSQPSKGAWRINYKYIG